MSTFRQPVRLPCLLLVLCLALSSCGDSPVISGSNTAPGNAMNKGKFSLADGLLHYYDDGMVWCMNPENDEITLNCLDAACKHNSYACAAYIRAVSPSFQQVGGAIYAVTTKGELFRYAFGERQFVAETPAAGESIYFLLFDNRIAWFDTGEEKLKINDLSTGRETNQFDNCQVFTDGFFHYGNAIYFINADLELCKASLTDGSVTVLESEGATRAMEYRDLIYYVKMDEASGENLLICMNSDGSDKRLVARKAYYYNIKDDRIYYSNWPGQDLWVCSLDGGDAKMLVNSRELGDTCGFVYVFDDYDRILFAGTFGTRFYSVKPDGSDLKKHEAPEL